ncbi:MAG: hypothetical protein JSS30_06375 [Verrucomicrobia bacterium]|nr:hypothetical protein [Verrucomicrobiota bacterium]
MIRKEYERLLGLLSQGERVKLEEVLQEAVVFFETLRKEFPNADKETREEMVQMMTQLHSKLQEVAKTTAEASGMTEEELTAYAENPSNFTPEQWQLVQKTRRELYDSARKFSSTMSEQPSEAPKKKTVKEPVKRAKRQDWTKS